MKQKLLLAAGLVITVILVVALNVLSNQALSGVRVDLTEDKLFTLTEGTENIVDNLEEPVTLKFYFSRKLAQDQAPGILPFATRVQEVLEEYESINPDKLRLEIIEPEPFSEEEDEAALAGLEGVPIQTGDVIFFGLHATNSIDGEETIPFFQAQREAYLEYDLSELIFNLSTANKPTIGVVTDLPVTGSSDPMLQFTNPSAVQQPWAVYSEIVNLYDVQQVVPASPISDDIDVLFVIHPKDLPETSQYHIEQFILRGGRAMFFVDPHAEIEQVPQDPNQPMAALFASKESRLGMLAEMLGVDTTPAEFVGDRDNAQRIAIRNERGLTEPADYVGYIGLDSDNTTDDIITASLNQQLVFATAGEIFETGDAETQIIPLITTSERSDMFSVEDIKVSPNPDELLKQFESDDKKRNLAVRVTGPAKSAWQGGINENDNADHLDESEGDINVIVVSDVDMIFDRFWVRIQNFLGQQIRMPVADNGRFVLNSLENLTGNSDLISIRSRGVSQRPFTLVEELARKAGEELQAREQELEDRVQEINTELQTMAQETPDDTLSLTAELEERMEEAREEYAEARRELRSVRQNLNEDVENLGSKMRLYNILLLPAIITVLAFIVGIFRNQRRRNAKR